MSFELTEISGDLFSCPSDFSLAHCVSSDFSMSKGIAVEFKKRFQRVGQLRAQGNEKKTSTEMFVNERKFFLDAPVGGCAFLKDENHFIFYLVTKTKYFHRPTMNSLENSLIRMRDLCVENGVSKLAMPRIGCGLDRLRWDVVCPLIRKIFQDTTIEIRIYLG